MNTLKELLSLLNNLEVKVVKHILFSGDFDLYFNIFLDAKGGSPVLKKHSLNMIVEIKKRLDDCDIRRIRNPKTRQYAFRQ